MAIRKHEGPKMIAIVVSLRGLLVFAHALSLTLLVALFLKFLGLVEGRAVFIGGWQLPALWLLGMFFMGLYIFERLRKFSNVTWRDAGSELFWSVFFVGLAWYEILNAKTISG